ncbi:MULTISPECIES: histidine kinase [Bradyrhizobium]|uniref:Histidine kinase n=3 Tax=Bradyrhizobium TaxID=374 RepID=A0A410VJH2_9BRAD|nr:MULTISPECIES: histidine kinase [Bradyrhizobium]MCG2632879.1 histidine kinase [Bradyrhizobium zhengyangense]MCG2645492.1 histidine kinase [Bradyrhizobium zhengyangense]MCG2673051.1 histidine kinase [Bradyrhizobium zhengyangense]MDN4984422.1 histidine kinase [Bradyrhizobium sp. WYCCWR 13022]MDN5002415.1 histidine kinase [Bradyrhizobium sp. WYCCWR 12677]
MAAPDGEQHLTPAPPPHLSRAGEVLHITRRERDLLCALSYVHLACGQSAQSLALLQIVAHEHSYDVELLRILVYALISEGHGDDALAALDRLDKLDDDPSSRLPLMVLRSHALRQAGRMAEARALFKSYVSLRSAAPIKQ